MRLGRPRALLFSAFLAFVCPAWCWSVESGRQVLTALDAFELQGTPAGLQAMLAQLETADARTQQQFEGVAGRDLPASVKARLEATQVVYARGQGRLVEILKGLLGASTPDSDRGALIAEAREIARGVAKASATPPISAFELKTRAPHLVTPALPPVQRLSRSGIAAPPPALEPPIGSVPQLLQDLAASLGGPVPIYEFVRNGIQPDLYYGAMRDAVETYLEQSGNDVDSAGLLIQLLRARGIPARFARGTVLIDAATLMAMAGTANVEQAVRALERAGIPHDTVLGGGGITGARVSRVWVEAYIPYSNYRGALVDQHGPVWVSMDPGLKRLQPVQGLDVVTQLGFDPRATLDAYLSAPQPATPLEFTRDRVRDLLAAQMPGTPYEAVLNQRGVLGEDLGILPASLPYSEAPVDEVSYDVPEALQHQIRFLGEAQGTTILDATLRVSDLLGHRVTLSYIPATPEDAEVVQAYGGLASTPPYLIRVKPLLKIGGVNVAAGSGDVGMAVRYTLRVQLLTPGGTEEIENDVLAGNMLAVGVGGRRITASEPPSSVAAAMLARLAWDYLDRWNHSDDELANLLRVVPVRPTVSICYAASDFEVEYAGGDPLYPLSFDWKGIFIDADLRSTAPVGLESHDSERSFLLLSGLEGSVLENRVFEDELQIEAVSTAKALGLAHAQGLTVYDLTQDNVDAILPGLPLDAAVKAEIQDATGIGLLARVPAADVQHLAWSGVGYLLLDQETGEAAYQLQGGHSGGVTAPSVIAIPGDIIDPLEQMDDDLPPAHEGADVAQVQKYVSTDFQEGTVGKPVAKPLRVLVSDANGIPVANAPVEFDVIGGEGAVVDPVTQLAGSKVVVRSDADGKAAVSFILGTHTDLIPRFEQNDGDEYPTQVGVNLVTVTAGTAVLAEPFTALGQPDRRFDGQFDYVTLLPRSFDPGPWANMRVAGLWSMAVTDQYGNPISNVPVRYAYRPLPEQMPPLPGMHVIRPPTTTPGRLLSPADYGVCLETYSNPHWGDCQGEADVLLLKSSPQGSFAYTVDGDSLWSRYNFDIGTELFPTSIQTWSMTSGGLCPINDACTGLQGPWVTFGSRARLANLNGDMFEAYPLNGAAGLRFWASSLSEIEQVVKNVDDQGKVSYGAMPTGLWRNEHILGSTYALSAVSPGTGVDPQTQEMDHGDYVARMTMAANPELNTVHYDGAHRPLVLPYLEGTTNLDPAYVTDDGVHPLTVERIPDPGPARHAEGDFDLWGIRVQISAIEPNPIVVNNGVVAEDSLVVDAIEPLEYRELLGPLDVFFELKRDTIPVLSAVGTGEFEIPTGLPFPSGNYEAQVRVLGVAGGLDVSSPSFAIAQSCPLLDLQTPSVSFDVTQDPLNGTACASDAGMSFALCEAANVTILVDGVVLTAELDNSGSVTFQNTPVSGGQHHIKLGADLLNLADKLPFSVVARSQSNPTAVASADGTLEKNIRNRAVLPVGRTFAKGVDLFDGHPVQSATDLSVPGRHLGLSLTRTYSGAGHSAAGVMGAGWSWTFGSTLFEQQSCGIVTATLSDGSSQVFHTADQGQTYTPQKGYHTRLEKQGSTFILTDKAGVKHHFDQQADAANPGEMRLAYVEDPHGDRLVPSYDGKGLVTGVAEVQGGVPARQLIVTYVHKGGFDRIETAGIPELQLHADYSYDDKGNLVRAVRRRDNVSGPPADEDVVWSYEYRTTDVRDPHQLTASVDPNGNRVELEYFLPSEPFPGETPTFLVLDKDEYVKKVHEHAGDSEPDTEFRFDVSDATHLHWKTTVKDPRHNQTLYVLNGNGSPLEIDEPLGKTTLLDWSDTDIFKTKETDANLRVTTYGHDANGNLTRETILSADQTIAAETTYAYDPTFNKLTHKQDAEGRETSYGIDARGDLRSMQDALGNLTQYEYDEGQAGGPGLLTRVTDPRGHATLQSGHDSFGHPTLSTDALGNTAHSTYDVRGRLAEAQDSFGRHSTVEYDGLDRIRTETHFSGGPAGNEDAVVQKRYFPGGELEQEENANGAVTTYTLDGLNRVTGTVTEAPGLSLSTAVSYDESGNKLTETDRRGVVRKNAYDALNRLSAVQIVAGIVNDGPLGTIASYAYDAVGNKTFETDVAGNRTDFEYDALYRVTKKLLPESGSSGRYFEAYTYDRVGNKLTFQDANGKVTQYGYDGLNRVQAMVRDLGGVNLSSRAEYDDPEGSHVNKSAEVDEARGLRTEYGYDPLGRELQRKQLLLKDGSGGLVSPNDAVVYVTATSYDDAAHAVTVIDPDLHVTRTVLDGLDRAVEHAVDPGGLNLVTQTTYDGLGNKHKLTDPRQQETAFETDGLGRTTRITDANQQDTVVEYDGEGLKTSETDRRGVRKDFTHDNLSRPRKTTLVPSITGVGWSQETQYLDAARQRKEIDARLTPTTFDLDKLGRVVKETDTYGKSVQTTWDGVNKRQVRDKRGNVTSLDYDGLNRLTVTTDPLIAGQSAPYVFRTDYLDSLNRSIETDRRGTIKTTQLDPLGRAVAVTRDGTLLERNSYDGVGNKVLAEDADGTKTSFEYDPANRLESQVAGFGSSPESTTTFKHDENGNVEEERDQRSIDLGLPYAVKRTFDALNRVSTEVDSDGRTTTHGYDEEGNRTLLREPDLQETAYVYDELGKLIQVDETAVPGGVPQTVYTYDPDRNRTRQEDSNHNVVEMSYDLLNRLDLMTQKGSPEGDLVTDHDYDENGNETKLTDPKGQTVTNTYDELNRLKTKAYAFAPDDPYRPWRHTVSVAYSHDPNSNLIRQDESVASGTDPPSETVTIERTFDNLDRLQTETETLPDAGPKTLAYTYWPNGLRKTLTDPESGLTSYTYDSQNRLETVTTALGTTSYTYYGDGLLHEVTEPDGSKATHSYDNADRLLSVVHTQGATTLASYSYTYDDNGNRLTQVETNGTAEATAYTYDDLNRLETVTYPADATFPEGRKVEYGYDLVGNRISEITKNPQTDAVLASKTGSFDALNRLTVLTDNLDPSQTLTLGWDKDGNQTSKQVGAGTPTYYRYDVRDKTVEVQEGTGSILVRYQHDAEGRLLKKIGEDGIRLYVHDQTARLSEYADTGLRVAQYTYGSDRLISLQHQTEGTRFYHLDGLGSVSTLTDTAGGVVSRLHTDAFGNLRFPTEMNASANRFAFTGYTFEREVGLYDAKARLYDPETARFTSQDFFLGKIDDPPSLHRYFYANDNPTRYTDPDGHESLGELAARERARREEAGPHESAPAYTNDQSGQVVRADGPVTVPDRGRTDGAMYEDELRLDPDMRRRFAEAKAKAGMSTAATQVTEEAPQGTGDPAIDALLKQRQDVLKAGAMVGVVGTRVGEAGISLLWSPLDNALILRTGKDINGHEASRLWASVAMGAPVILNVGGKAIKIIKESENLAEDLRAFGRIEREARIAEKEIVAVEQTGANVTKLGGEVSTGAEITLRRPPGVTDTQWQKKMDALERGVAEGRAKVVHNPVRSGTAQKEARAEGIIDSGDHADHGLDLQYGGDDTRANIQSTNARVNTSVGAQGRQRLRYPDGTPIVAFKEEK